MRDPIKTPDADEAVKALNIGRKIRELRKGKALTLQDLSVATGLSKPLLSQIENEIVLPPISTLLRISRALDQDIVFFFQEPDDDRKIAVVRSSERERIDTRRPGGEDGGYSYEALAYKKSKKNMEPFLVEFKRREEKGMSFDSHEGEEFVFVLEGSLEFQTRDEVHQLTSGDSLYFESNIPHAYRTLGPKNAKAVVVVFSSA